MNDGSVGCTGIKGQGGASGQKDRSGTQDGQGRVQHVEPSLRVALKTDHCGLRGRNEFRKFTLTEAPPLAKGGELLPDGGTRRKVASRELEAEGFKEPCDGLETSESSFKMADGRHREQSFSRKTALREAVLLSKIAEGIAKHGKKVLSNMEPDP